MRKLICKLFGHFWGPWVVRGHKGYEKRWCRLCNDWEMRSAVDRLLTSVDETAECEEFPEFAEDAKLLGKFIRQVIDDMSKDEKSRKTR